MKTTSYTQEQLDAVQTYVQERIKVAASQNEAATQLGLSAAQLIAYREARWESVSAKAFNEMLAKCGHTAWPTIPTYNLSAVMTMCGQAQTKHKMLGLTGYTGAGKTHALRKYARTLPSVYYVLVDVTMSRWAFLNEVCQACGVSPDLRGNTPAEMVAAVVAKLRATDSPLLILDDAGKATDDVFRIIQVIYDRTEHSAGIVLAGTEHLAYTIERKARLRSKSFAELKRRVAWWETLPPLAIEDVTNVCTKTGVADGRAIKYLSRNVADLGTLRHMIENSKLEASHRGAAAVTAELLTDMNAGREWHRG